MLAVTIKFCYLLKRVPLKVNVERGGKVFDIWKCFHEFIHLISKYVWRGVTSGVEAVTDVWILKGYLGL
jgi:hypothetical protein